MKNYSVCFCQGPQVHHKVHEQISRFHKTSVWTSDHYVFQRKTSVVLIRPSDINVLYGNQVYGS